MARRTSSSRPAPNEVSIQPGATHVHAHARRDRARQRLAEGEHAALHRGEQLRVEPGHAGEHVIPAHVDDDAALLLRAQHLRRAPRGEHRPAQIDREQQVQLLDVRERGAGAGEDVGAGVVHPDVEAPERVAGRRAERAHATVVGQVEPDDGRAASERLDLALDVPRTVLVRPIGQRDVGAGASGGERDRPADPAGRAGHEHGAAGQRRSDGVASSSSG